MPRLSSLLRFTAIAGLVGLGAWGGSIALAPPYDGAIGFQKAKAYAPVRDDTIDFHIWYPAMPGGREVTVGGNGVFYGTPAGKGAPVQSGQHPLVLISHGAGGNAGQFGWIASALVARGYAVALPNHPGSTSGNASASEAVKVWKRPPDVSAVIDAISDDPDTFGFVDTDRIATVGFSAGGYTALALAGGVVVPDRLSRFCDDGNTGMSDCTFFERAGLNLHDIDFAPAAQVHHDARIKASVLVDPGIITAITDDSLAAIDTPVLVINLGAPDDIPPAVDASHAASVIPRATYETVSDAIHFSFLAECKPKGAAILKKEGELDRLCDDADGRDRSALHAAFQKMIGDYLDASL